MPFIPIYNIAKYQNYKDSPKIAKVINNNDPNKLGRIKVSLPGMFEPKDEEGSNLPWIRMMQDTFLNGCGEMFSVPLVGSYVEILWPYDNKNCFYRGIPYGVNNCTKIFTNDYPNEWGLTDGNFIFKVNRVTNEYTVKTPKSTVIVDTDGNVIVTTDSNVTVTAEGDIDLKGKNISISGDDISIKGSTVTIGDSTTIDNKNFLSHKHGNGNDGKPTNGVI